MEMKRILGLRLNLGNSLGLLLCVKEGYIYAHVNNRFRMHMGYLAGWIYR